MTILRRRAFKTSACCPVNSEGQMYKDDNPYEKENWYAYGAAVAAPGAGVVVIRK